MTHHACQSGTCRRCGLEDDVRSFVFHLLDAELDIPGEDVGRAAAAAERAVRDALGD